MEFPTYVYQDNGPFQRKGGTYKFCIVEDQSDFDAALKNGWFATLDEAIAPKVEAPKQVEVQVEVKQEVEPKSKKR